MIRVIDNVISDSYADKLEQDARNVLRYNYNVNTSYPTEDHGINDSRIYDKGQFICPIIIDHELDPIFGSYLDIIEPLISSVMGKVPEINFSKLDRIKVNLLLQQENAPIEHYNTPHTDSNNYYSMVYYINDTDGDTVLFNEFIDGPVVPTLTVAQRISPKKNRVVLFESSRYHASCSPILNKDRFVINFVLG